MNTRVRDRETEVIAKPMPSAGGVSSGNQMVEYIAKAEMQEQMAYARANPRSITNFIQEALDLATLNEDIASQCIYALPRWDSESNQNKTIEGPSVRLAEILVSAWGHCRAGARIIDEGAEFVTAQGLFHDLQTNAGITFEVQRRIVNRHGKRYSADMIGVTANAACSIALRNAVFKGIPKAYWNGIYEASRKVVAGDFTTLAKKREVLLDALQKMGVARDKVLEKLDLKGTADIGNEHLVLLTGFRNAIRDGEATAEDIFSATAKPPSNSEAQTQTERVKEQLRKRQQESGPRAEVKATQAENSEPTASTGESLEELKQLAIRTMDAAYQESDREKLKQIYVEVDAKYRARKKEIPLAVEAKYRELILALDERGGQ